MIVIGPELVSRGTAKILEVLLDISDMIKQSQNVIQSLFVHHFFLSVFRSILPDSTHLEAEKSIFFLLYNFAAMNRIWVRISTSNCTQPSDFPPPIDNNEQGQQTEQPDPNEASREQKKELSVLIGINIARIASLKHLTIEMYKKLILPKVGKHVELCEDDIAQEFILQSIVQAFPVEYHIQTIDSLFSLFNKVEQGVELASIISQLLDRLLDYDFIEIDNETRKTVFLAFAKHIEGLFNIEGGLTLFDKIEILKKLLQFSLKLNIKEIRNIKNLFKFAEYICDLSLGDQPISSQQASTSLASFIKCPFYTFVENDKKDKNTLELFYQIEDLSSLIKRLLPHDRYEISTEICKIIVTNNTIIHNIQEFQFVLSLTSYIVREGPGNSYFFSLLQVIDAGSIEETMSIIAELEKVTDTAFTEQAARNSIMPIGFKVIRLMHDSEKNELIKLVQYLAHLCKKHVEKNVKTCIQLYIEAARTLDHLGIGVESTELAVIAIKEFYPQFVSSYSINQQFSMLLYLIHFVVSSQNIDFAEINGVLCTYASSFSTIKNEIGDSLYLLITKLFINCANLFWRPDQRVREAKHVQSCLANACKAAADCTDISISVESLYLILNWTAYFLEAKCEINMKWVRALISLINKKHKTIKQSGRSINEVLSMNIRLFYSDTVANIEAKQLIENEAEDEDEGEIPQDINQNVNPQDTEEEESDEEDTQNMV